MMCGRAYSTYTEEEIRMRYLNMRKVKIPPFKANYNLSPSHLAPIVRGGMNELGVSMLRWGLVPSWASDIKIGYKMINARGETLHEKPSFRAAFKRRRCIVPLSGFIEWKREGEVKRPFAISLKSEPIMSLAGIWESWPDPKGEILESFSIVTTEANAFMAKIHDRMPVILAARDEAEWLDPENEDTAALARLLKPCPASWLKSFEVSTLINSPKNNRPEVLTPV